MFMISKNGSANQYTIGIKLWQLHQLSPPTFSHIGMVSFSEYGLLQEKVC